jgi:peptidoglycan glycosyltransferase
MAMVAAGVANGGSVMRPFVVDRILKPDSSILTKTSPDQFSQAVSPATAADLTAMMELVVESGTGTAAQIPGVRVAGKTGTAETGRAGENDVWFVGFAPADNPQVAVAVALSDQTATGGAVAAPIARAIMEAVLR